MQDTCSPKIHTTLLRDVAKIQYMPGSTYVTTRETASLISQIASFSKQKCDHNFIKWIQKGRLLHGLKFVLTEEVQFKRVRSMRRLVMLQVTNKILIYSENIVGTYIRIH